VKTQPLALSTGRSTWLRTRRRAGLGFTLLEVLVAIAILGLGLTIVLSAQTGIFWSYSRARHLSQAPGLLRCKMAEVELELLKLGFPLTEQVDDGECCEDQAAPGYTCEWKVQTVKLPELPADGAMGGDGGVGGGIGGGLGALGSLATLQQNGGTGLGKDPQVSDLTSMMGEGASMSGIAPMVMGFVYPDLKPMLEASIRKITVTVRWKEGETDRDLVVTQYVTSPQQGGFDPNAAAGIDQAVEGALDQVLGTQGQDTPGATKGKEAP
jgi:general secretion pathway protein I